MGNLSVDDIVQRIMLVLPSKFDKANDTDLYAFWYGIAAALEIDSDLIDELFKQTNLIGLANASSGYVDEYINSLANIGRLTDETDEDYKERYSSVLYKYNCSSDGIASIVLDLYGQNPDGMVSAKTRGAFLDSEYYYDDAKYMSFYGMDGLEYQGYVILNTKPSDTVIDRLCSTINAVKASGIYVYIVFPS